MGHGASSARRKAPAAPAAPAHPREKRPSKIAGRPEDEAADGPPLTHAEAARLARSRTSAMLERILDDRRECEILEAFLHSEYRVDQGSKRERYSPLQRLISRPFSTRFG